MPRKEALRNPLILPKFEHLDVVIFVVERVKVTSVRELDLCATLDVVVAELGRGHIVAVDCVNLDSI